MRFERAESIAARLPRPSQNGQGWIACCPAHDDTNPSLSITEHEGKVLFKCFAGCSQEVVIAALKSQGLWPTPSAERPRKTTYTYHYPDHQPDEKTVKEGDYLNAITDDLRQTTELRREYADISYRFLRWWVICVGILLVLDALDKPPICEESATIYPRLVGLCQVVPSFDIEGKVMLGVVGGTTVAVIGLALAVVKGLFPTTGQ